MKTKFIKIDKMSTLFNFVEEAQKVSGDIIVTRGNFSVDGKSFMGLVYLNTIEGCSVQYPDEAINFENFLSTLNK